MWSGGLHGGSRCQRGVSHAVGGRGEMEEGPGGGGVIREVR